MTFRKVLSITIFFPYISSTHSSFWLSLVILIRNREKISLIHDLAMKVKGEGNKLHNYSGKEYAKKIKFRMSILGNKIN